MAVYNLLINIANLFSFNSHRNHNGNIHVVLLHVISSSILQVNGCQLLTKIRIMLEYFTLVQAQEVLIGQEMSISFPPRISCVVQNHILTNLITPMIIISRTVRCLQNYFMKMTCNYLYVYFLINPNFQISIRFLCTM